MIIGAALLLVSAAWSAQRVTVWDQMLAKVNLTSDKAQLNPGRWRGGGEYSLKTFNSLWDDWRKVDPTTVQLGKDVAGTKSLYRLGWHAARYMDMDPRVIPFHYIDSFRDEPMDRWAGEMEAKPMPQRYSVVRRGPLSPRSHLVYSVTQLHASYGSPLNAEQTTELNKNAENVPEDVASAACTVLDGVLWSLDSRAKAFSGFHGSVYEKALPFATDYAIDDDTLKLIDNVGLQDLVDGGLELADAVDKAVAQMKTPSRQKSSFKWTTPAGDVILNGSGNDTYSGSWLLAIDTSGNEQYESSSQVGKQTACVTIDCAGNDTYTLKDKGAFGGGTAVAGYSFQVDCAGSDTYTADNVAFGTAAFGVGMLLDMAGNDTYKVRNLGIGAGVFGIGALIDDSGDDHYECYMEAQGFAGPRGFGVLLDRKGNDTYNANDTNVVNPSPQTAEHNTSLAQGCSFGRRAHPGDGHSMAGGVGALVDCAGNDKYSSGVFGQGVSYWYGYGALVDFKGNDSYRGVWYAQGASAHYSVAALYDGGGDDNYVSIINQSQGHARDYSIGVLHDVSGNDSYSCPAWALGSGNISSIGIFWDERGDDTYAESAMSFGYADPSNPAMALGLFRDDGGKNTFPANSPAKNKSTWVQNPTFPIIGVGMAK